MIDRQSTRANCRQASWSTTSSLSLLGKATQELSTELRQSATCVALRVERSGQRQTRTCRETTMTDRELLEAAAKAAGIRRYDYELRGYFFDPEFNEVVAWNPLENDGDALRLAHRLNISVSLPEDAAHVLAVSRIGIIREPGSVIESVRRAIVRAAAAIGGAQP